MGDKAVMASPSTEFKKALGKGVRQKQVNEREQA